MCNHKHVYECLYFIYLSIYSIDRVVEFPRLIDSKSHNIPVSVMNCFISSSHETFHFRKLPCYTLLCQSCFANDVQSLQRMASPFSSFSDEWLIIYYLLNWLLSWFHVEKKDHFWGLCIIMVEVFANSSSVIVVWTFYLCYKVSKCWFRGQISKSLTVKMHWIL